MSNWAKIWFQQFLQLIIFFNPFSFSNNLFVFHMFLFISFRIWTFTIRFNMKRTKNPICCPKLRCLLCCFSLFGPINFLIQRPLAQTRIIILLWSTRSFQRNWVERASLNRDCKLRHLMCRFSLFGPIKRTRQQFQRAAKNKGGQERNKRQLGL